MWGETGRYPLVIELSSQVYGYLERLEKLHSQNSSSLVQHAYTEQKRLNLTWSKRLDSVRSSLSEEIGNGLMSPREIRNAIKDLFVSQWNRERQENKKLGFYNSIKAELGCENYLSADLFHQQVKRVTEFRTSSHQYKIKS
jgi:hypothetical protein